MPSYHSRTIPPYNSHLSEIINLYPDEEPYCAGYAPSQGRRCHNRTNARGRKTAMSLLNKGTKDLHAGRDIEDLLYELAPNVLCTRYHQSQDTSLVGKWLRKIDRFLDSYNSPAPAPTRPAFTRRKPETPWRMSAQPSQAQNIPVESRNEARGEETIWRSTMTSLELLETLVEQHLGAASSPQFSTAATSNSHVHSASRTSLTSSSERRDTEAATTPVSTMTSAHSQSQIPRRRSSPENSDDSSSSTTGPARPSTSPRLIRQVAFTESEHTSMRDRDMSTSASARTSNRTREPIRPRTRIKETAETYSTSPKNAVRRPIEGDCSICLELLHTIHDNNNENDDTDSGNEDNEEEQEIAWCKVQCGNNYHKNCIEQWLGTAVKSTCPTCRKPWRN